MVGTDKTLVGGRKPCHRVWEWKWGGSKFCVTYKLGEGDCLKQNFWLHVFVFPSGLSQPVPIILAIKNSHIFICSIYCHCCTEGSVLGSSRMSFLIFCANWFRTRTIVIVITIQYSFTLVKEQCIRSTLELTSKLCANKLVIMLSLKTGHKAKKLCSLFLIWYIIFSFH